MRLPSGDHRTWKRAVGASRSVSIPLSAPRMTICDCRLVRPVLMPVITQRLSLIPLTLMVTCELLMVLWIWVLMNWGLKLKRALRISMETFL